MQENPYRIGMRKKGQAIDLGGIAKGFAADWAKEMLLKYQVEEAIINFGGTVIVIGQEKTIGIQNPEYNTGNAMGSFVVKNQAVVTSGVYERYFIKDNIRYHHILDLHTGRPSNTGIAGITVIGESAMKMDALATSVILLGIEDGIELIRQCNAEGIFIMDTKEVYTTPGLTSKFQMINLEENSNGKQ
jgi:thiamine biosynthesis lipoprotein